MAASIPGSIPASCSADVPPPASRSYAGFCELQLIEKELRELPVVVLPSVQNGLIEACFSGCLAKRPGLDELGPIADNCQ